MPLPLSDTALEDVKLVSLREFVDERGSFMELFRAGTYHGLPGQTGSFVQDNFSSSRRDVLRGLHFQHPNGQGKLVRAVYGSVYDVTVDIRAGSPSFGQWQAITLRHDKPQQLWVPPGYAHGFLVLSDFALVEYKCTEYYSPETESCLYWNDPHLGIDWPTDAPLVSEKDRNGQTLKQLLEAGRCPRYE
ncbi:dTDP-4-dehydrorhamnose 3,5-epimerase [Pusillimonas sp. (ex Stolz et al. 2005)]|uniref:dTDP-4-dehydrorhamnose 3,5-epimerase n=1 Tax=Pusillimonas sp. (ex Stolz et al. 2005) TaxID=1979962 RepID=UPI00263742BB|nr:dTDP-4-dehydrorhamnose 3,5-epimerase [Pusillimonas sp. (ex Stolz et al. 2005)]